MPSPGRMSELASHIQTHTAKIEEYLIGQNLPLPSLDVEAVDVGPLPPQLNISHETILDSIDELRSLALGPLACLMRLTAPQDLPISLQAIYRFNIASRFAIDEQVSYAELAKRCGLGESDTKRIIRLAVAHRIFCEPRKDVVAHTAMSKLLAQVPTLHQWNGYIVEEMWPASIHTVDAMMKWPGSEDPKHTGFALANGVDRAFFDELGKDQDRANRFSTAMQVLQNFPTLDPAYLLDNLGWEDDCPQLVVDVGGSYGSIACQILRKYPTIQAVVEDLPEVVAKAQIPPDLDQRLSFRAHNFFTEQPVKGADVYLLRSIFHDWPDQYAVQILRNLVPAMKPGARVLLNEACLPEMGLLSHYQEQQLRAYDLAMKSLMNAKERNADEWVELFGKADPRFGTIKIKSPPQSMLSIIEATWQEMA